jgi:hypothetical protein
MEILVMTDIEDTNAEPQEEVQAEVPMAKIVVYMEGDSPVPAYIDFVRVTPFHLIAIGEWLSLKGRQMIALSEGAEVAASGIQVPNLDSEEVQEILKVKR